MRFYGIIFFMPDYSGFDSTSLALIKEYEAAGWTGDKSSKGHFILQAPDGVTTTSVTRNLDKNPMYAQNARRPLAIWKRKVKLEQQVADEVASFAPRVKADTAFGAAEVIQQEGTKLFCPQCGKQYSNVQSLAYHIEAKHPEPEPELTVNETVESKVEVAAIEPAVTATVDGSPLTLIEKISRLKSAVLSEIEPLFSLVEQLALDNSELLTQVNKLGEAERGMVELKEANLKLTAEKEELAKELGALRTALSGLLKS